MDACIVSRIWAAVLFLLCAAALPIDAGESKVEWKKVLLDGTEGMTVFYQDSGPGDARTLVFIHGWACDSSFWQAQIDGFAGRYRCLALDLPGFGRSGKPQDIAYTLNLFSRAVKAVVDDADAGKPVLIGHSMGFAVARQFMSEYPGTTAAAVNVDGALMYYPEDPAGRAAIMAMMGEFTQALAGPQQKTVLEGFIKSIFYGKTPENIQATVRAAMSAVDPYVCVSSMTEFLKPEWWQLHTFSEPCLALYAENPMEDPNLEQNLRKEFPDMTYELWDDTGHFLMMEKPERFNAALQGFLDATE